jgi:peptide/nickel transport system permease protein
MRTAGQFLLAFVVLVAVAAPWLAPNSPDQRFPDLLYAPPTAVHAGGGLHIFPWRLVSRLERRFVEDREQAVPLRWFANGRLVSADAPLLLLGADAYGRDILARLLYAARVSLALALVSTLVAMLLGTLIGGVAGYAGGWLDDVLSRTSDFILVLPATYVVLALRAVMPLVLPPATIFALLAGIFALVGWPIVARGVRGIVAAEREREYVQAGRALGASSSRLVVRHLLPAARGHLLTQGTLLLPAFILAEATLSYVGFGFPDSIPTWGTMLQEATNGSLIAESPWMLAPAAAIFIVVLAVNLVVQGTGRAPVQLES